MRLLFVGVFFIYASLIYAGEVYVMRGKSADFSVDYVSDKKESSYTYFAKADLPEGTTIQLYRPGKSYSGSDIKPAKIVIVQRVAFSKKKAKDYQHILISPAGADYFGIKDDAFLIVSDSDAGKWNGQASFTPVQPSKSVESSKSEKKQDEAAPINYETEKSKDDYASDSGSIEYMLQPVEETVPPPANVGNVVDIYEKEKDESVIPPQKNESEITDVAEQKKSSDLLESKSWWDEIKAQANQDFQKLSESDRKVLLDALVPALEPNGMYIQIGAFSDPKYLNSVYKNLIDVGPICLLRKKSNEKFFILC